MGYDQLLQPQMFVSVYEELLLKFRQRTEIHLTHFNSATANGQLADNEVLEVIKAVNNTWALCVPDKFAYPTETTVITNAYSKFADWAHDQSSTTDWYKTVSSDKVIQY